MKEEKVIPIGEGTDIVIRNTQDLTKTIINVKHDLPKYWDRDYINNSINNIENHQHRMLITYLWYSGLRVTEAISLRKKDIDFKNNEMIVRWLKNRKFNHRVVTIHPNLQSVLIIFVATLKAEDRVFPISRQRAWQITKKCLGGHPHQLRHSFAVNWLRCGGNIVTLSRMMGHSKIQSTMEYLKIVPVDQRKELLKIDFV